MKRILNFAGALLFSASVSASPLHSDSIKTPNDELFSKHSHPQEYCMAMNIYHESRSDNLAGQFAVADVVLNRVAHSRWPGTVCEVITDAKLSNWWLREHGKIVPIKHKCQFSWYCDGKRDDVLDKQSWRKAQVVAYQIMNKGMYRGISEGATHYHATYVNPSWNQVYASVGRIGLHLFFRSP